jgi:death-on-curing protein
MDPHWITDEVVRSMHTKLLRRYGGADGLRDESLLASAMARPQQLLNYGDPPPNIFELAASYSYGIVKNHPFIDGNKRTGFMIGYAFLFANGYHLQAPEIEAYKMTVDLASSNITEADYANWLSNSCEEV